eukprot:461434-Pelagomonas_calceolata.AAC.12
MPCGASDRFASTSLPCLTVHQCIRHVCSPATLMAASMRSHNVHQTRLLTCHSHAYSESDRLLACNFHAIQSIRSHCSPAISIRLPLLRGCGWSAYDGSLHPRMSGGSTRMSPCPSSVMRTQLNCLQA